MLRIGEFARLSRVSIRMLRHYDRLGLLPPAHVDPTTGYRYYRAGQLPALHHILAMRDLGFRLDEIATASNIELRYERREQELLTQLEMTEAQLTALRARRAAQDADVVIRTVPAERVATIRAPRGTDVEGLFNTLETFVGAHHARADRPPLTLLDRESVTVAVPVNRAVPPADGIELRTLPPTTMACFVHSGPYAELQEHLQRMLEWLARTGRRPDGPLREVYLRFGAEPELGLPPTHVADESDPGYITELQLPVRQA
jgi:DNA-binding transcriptional MerR regulator